MSNESYTNQRLWEQNAWNVCLSLIILVTVIALPIIIGKSIRDGIDRIERNQETILKNQQILNDNQEKIMEAIGFEKRFNQHLIEYHGDN